MVSNSAKLDRRTSSTINLDSLRVMVPEIWPGQNRGRKKENNEWPGQNRGGKKRKKSLRKKKIGGKKNCGRKKKITSELDGKQECKIRLQDQAAHPIWSLCE